MKLMRCMACERPTIMAYRKQGIEAAFCPMHPPQENRKITIKNYMKLFLQV